MKVTTTPWDCDKVNQIVPIMQEHLGPVVIHRSDSETILNAKHRRWKHLYDNGGVLVSPFISQAENLIDSCSRHPSPSRQRNLPLP